MNNIPFSNMINSKVTLFANKEHKTPLMVFPETKDFVTFSGKDTPIYDPLEPGPGISNQAINAAGDD